MRQQFIRATLDPLLLPQLLQVYHLSPKKCLCSMCFHKFDLYLLCVPHRRHTKKILLTAINDSISASKSFAGGSCWGSWLVAPSIGLGWLPLLMVNWILTTGELISPMFWTLILSTLGETSISTTINYDQLR